MMFIRDLALKTLEKPASHLSTCLPRWERQVESPEMEVTGWVSILPVCEPCWSGLVISCKGHHAGHSPWRHSPLLSVQRNVRPVVRSQWEMTTVLQKSHFSAGAFDSHGALGCGGLRVPSVPMYSQPRAW